MSGGATLGKLGKYEVRGTLGKGAMGTVYDGWDPAIDRRVAIKTVRLPGSDDEEAAEGLARFKREAQAAGRLTHPNIVGVFDYGETDEVAYIVMEFVEGRSLKEVLAAGERMPATGAVALMLEVLAGLAYSHARGVVHRDIKPANIMMARGEGGGGVQAKIADFGIARIEASSMTQAGTVMGTPAYMSPEQFMGQAVDGRTDIYSSGVMLYQLLTGDRPFDGSMTAIMHKVMTTVPPRPSELAVTAPGYLDTVVLRAMARRPEDRFATAAEFAQALRAGPTVHHAEAERAADPFESDATVMAVPPRAEPVPAVEGTAATVRAQPRSRMPLLAGGGLVAAAVAAAVAWFAWPPAPVPAPPVRTTMTTPVPPPTQPSQQPTTQPPVEPAQQPPITRDPPARADTPPTPAEPPARTPVQPPVPPEPVRDPTPAERTPPGRQTVIGGVVIEPARPPTPVQPAQPPVQAPAEPPPRTAAMIEAALASGLPASACSLARTAVAADGTATVTGLVGAGPPSASLRRVVDGARPTSVQWQVSEFAGPFCPVLDLIRLPRATAGAQTEAVQAPPAGTLFDGQPIKLAVTMPDFGGYLHIEYMQSDGTVSPLLPGPGYPTIAYLARTKIDLDPPVRPNFPGWLVGSPYGKDLILVVASTAPLFQRPPPEGQPIATYMAALRAAIDDVRKRSGQVSATAVLLDTREK